MRTTQRGESSIEGRAARPHRERHRARAVAPLLLAALLASAACLPQSPGGGRGTQAAVTLYAFSVMKEAMEKSVIPAFNAKRRREQGTEAHFTTSYAGSETITNQILQGVGAHVGIFSIERDVERLAAGGAVGGNWQALPHRGVVNKTPFIILVRKGNPKNVSDFRRPRPHLLPRPPQLRTHLGARGEDC